MSTGRSTLLVDFDLRSPALHRALGMPGISWGVAQMLAHRQFDERFVRQTALPDLDFLAAGKSERPAGELIEPEAVEWFMKEALQRYALIVIDTAPTLAVPDPLILGRVGRGRALRDQGRLDRAQGRRTRREGAARGEGQPASACCMNDSGEFLPQYYGYKSQYYGYTTEAAGR